MKTESIAPTKKRIIVDLDVVTIALWNKSDMRKERATALLKRLEAGDFKVYTPYSLLDAVGNWENEPLKKLIKRFYELNSEDIITAKEYIYALKETGKDDINIRNTLAGAGIKEEDILLIVISSVFSLDFLVTFNRKHLKGNEKMINEVLQKHGFRPIKIAFPNEI